MRKYNLKKSIRDASKNESTSFDPNSDSPRKAFKSPMLFGKTIAYIFFLDLSTGPNLLNCYT